MEEEIKNEEKLQESQQAEQLEETAEPLYEEVSTVAQEIEQINEENVPEFQLQDEFKTQEQDSKFESVAEVKKTKEVNMADYDMVSVSPVEFVSFEEEEGHLNDDPKANLDIMQDVKMHITVELGRARSSVKKILDLSKGSIVELNKVAGEQVELYANGRFIAYGEVIVIEDKFGLRVTNVSNQNIHNL